jgi:uncharacterized membrane protein YfcA
MARQPVEKLYKMLDLAIQLTGKTVSLSIPVLFFVGLVVGVLGGFFGVGGGWIVTPVLNILGLPMTHAVGTGFAYIFGMSGVSAWKHRGHNSIEYRLGIIIGLAMIIGVKLGKTTMMALASSGNADTVVRWIYVVFLLGLGAYMLHESLNADGTEEEAANGADAAGRKPFCQRLHLAPHIQLPRSGVRVALPPLVAIGLFAGYMSGIMGVGGGFLLMPIMVYLVGIPTTMAVGTSLLCILLASPFGLFEYGSEGFVVFAVAGTMIVGAVVGAPLGVWASKCLHGRWLRLMYAVMIMLGGLSVVFKQLAGMFSLNIFDLASRVIIFTAASGMALMILVMARQTKEKIVR